MNELRNFHVYILFWLSIIGGAMLAWTLLSPFGALIAVIIWTALCNLIARKLEK